jgi:DNA-binding response OmpR family regulator
VSETAASILIIEDEPELAELLAEDLADRGFRVSIATEGAAGLAAIRSDASPDLVLCDVCMPQLSGFEVLESLTALGPHYQNIPFIFITSLGDRENQLKGRRLGADDYITKPVDFDLLESIIHNRLARVARIPLWQESLGLSEREKEVLTWSARGKTSDEMATILGLSKRTVDFYADSAREKLNVSTRSQAVAKAISGNLIKP